MSTHGEMIKAARKAKGWTQHELADKLGITRERLAQYEVNRSKPPLPVWEQMQTVMQMSGIEDSARNFEIINVGQEIPVARTGHRMVPIYGAITAGQPSYSIADAIDYIEMPEWGASFERWGRVITGESMAPEFEEGDIAIFENRRYEIGHGVHAFHDGEDSFKVVRQIDGKFELWPINSEYQPIDADGWKVKGVCIRRIRHQERGIVDTREYPYGFMWRFR
ncbi:MAG: LexA family transcriptional regulator [Fimbriimonadaceae bacterium]|nr:LexA family transcriptional regulator [Fimbriimonadaceae bacterium]